MRLFRETLLSVFVAGIVLYLYFVAAGAVLLSLFGFVSDGNEPKPLHQFAIAGKAKFQNRIR